MTAMLNNLHYKVEERHEKVKACRTCNELISNGCNEGVELSSFDVIRNILVKLQFKDETELVRIEDHVPQIELRKIEIVWVIFRNSQKCEQ